MLIVSACGYYVILFCAVKNDFQTILININSNIARSILKPPKSVDFEILISKC